MTKRPADEPLEATVAAHSPASKRARVDDAVDQDLPPPRTVDPPPPNVPIFGKSSVQKRVEHTGDDLQDPPYHIQNDAGSGALSDRTAYVSVCEAYLSRSAPLTGLLGGREARERTGGIRYP